MMTVMTTDMAVGQNLIISTFWEDYHLLKGFGSLGASRGFDP